MIKSLCVYCGASNKADEIYGQSALNLGKLMGEHKISLVYGGGRNGLMGIVADAVMKAGGKVTGFMPEHLQDFEGGHTGIDELHIVDTMHTRKLRMSELADAFVILPGGFGTLDELFEMLTWKKLGLHNKPIIVININGYWDPLITLINQVVTHKFTAPKDAELVTFINSVEEVIPLIKVM
jgi:uncharacterized protein (TIGR00730 family)